MKIFIKNFLLFVLPIVIVCASAEYLLRRIPNDYVFKKEYLDHNSNNISVLFMGSSHAFCGINPTESSLNSFNAAHVSQSLDYDFRILQKYRNNLNSLKCIVIPISYFSLFSKFDTEPESWRIKNYNIYYGMNTSRKFVHHTEIFGNILKTNLKRIYSYYILGNSNVSCSNLGWRINYNSKNKKDLNETGITAARRHTTKDKRYFKENTNVLISIIEFARNRGVSVLMYTPPAYHTYIEHLDRTQLNMTIDYVNMLPRIYQNTRYVNLLDDKSFTENDFYDADHLNELGAKILTLKLVDIINEMKLLTIDAI